ncbi:patatin-like phospholipase family protein [Vibrio sp. SCSIO 43137]|uniref:patatin-like phospholipase family protein n=1 Tax=Vibrio sp. SCSIO 43137 TaxID=3021011 RepID=UPI0023079459|nr:patatin-like phospholipase family protein [Vibrio sp. SCSIO 43137]WCE31286.1 patatin-like phospholipase family protein [Vibrio sp. SCSIO 43137]
MSCLLFPAVVSAESLASAKESNEAEAVKPSRPVIAVVLAGGGAKGAAHIGVLKALEEMHIPVDIVTGTSMGAYVGGLYATGMSADEIESLIYTTNWNDGYKDRVNRSERRVRDKAYEDYYQINTDLGLNWSEIRSPKGIVQGQGMMQILRETSGNHPSFKSFDELPLRYRAVATDIVHLEEVIIDKGLLTDAMMASMSVPGALPPYPLDGKLLVDGGVTNNMPVDLAKQMGADFVIAVDISTDYLDEDDVTDMMTVAGQISNYLVRRTTNEQTDQLSEQDTLLLPAVGDMETTEFDKMPQAFQWGYQEAIKQKEKLKRYSVSSAQYQNYIDQKQDARRTLKHGDELVVDNIVLNNHSHYRSDLVLKRLGVESGSRVSTEQLEASVRNLYALDRFETVSYHFENVDDETHLIFNVKEKEWGPNYVNFRFFLEEDFESDSQYAIGVSTNFTGLNSLGAELKLNVELGTDRQISANWSSPFFSNQYLLNIVDISYSKDKKNSPVDGLGSETSLEMADNSLSTTYTEFSGEAALGFQPHLWQEFRAGVRYVDGSVGLTTAPAFGKASYIRKGAFARYRLDTLDDFSLPTKGVMFNAEYFISDDSVQGSAIIDGQVTQVQQFKDDLVHEISLSARGAYSMESHTLVGHMEYGAVEDKTSNNPAIDPKELGGFLRLSGIPRNSLVGQNLFFSSLVYRYRWFENDFGLFTAPVYLGASYEYGGVWNDTKVKIKDAPLYHAGSLFAGIASPIGPIVFALGKTEGNRNSAYLILGHTF